MTHLTKQDHTLVAPVNPAPAPDLGTFEQRVRDTKRKAIMENIQLAEKNKNVLTQTLDENDNLVGVQQTVNFEEREPATEEMKNAQRDELYEKERNKAKADSHGP
jgi:anionic cell wall polymer biosynthesis LytR-Cps2A-Psr (LCP) family protein